MNSLVQLWKKPAVDELYMLAGWQQWADAGAISSSLPHYLIKKLQANKIGMIQSNTFYFFQIPGTHHFLRPEITLEDGYPVSISTRHNDFYYTSYQPNKGLIIFVGEEPHLAPENYAEAFLDAVQALNVKRVVAVGGVYGSMPYDKDREVSCVYSVSSLKEELARYAVRFSNYEGGATIGTYLAEKAKLRGIEFIIFYAFVPAYDFSAISPVIQGMRIENDFKAWYDVLRRIDHMLDLQMDMSDLEREANSIATSMEAELDDLDSETPDVDVHTYLQKQFSDFQERRFIPLGDMWERGLRDLFNDDEA